MQTNSEMHQHRSSPPPPRNTQIPISEEMADELTPPKHEGTGKDAGGGARKVDLGRGGENKEDLRQRGESKGENASEGREEVLRELAKACKRQGNFHLACKKYTQVLHR